MTLTRVALTNAGVGLRMDVLWLWGSFLVPRVIGARSIGLGVHLGGSAAIAVGFAWAFESLGITNGAWAWGLVGGLVLWAVAGIFLAALPLVHPRIAREAAWPGAFALRAGRADAVVFLIGHLMYGTVVGVVYALLNPDAGPASVF